MVYGFVQAEALHCVDIRSAEVVARDVALETAGGVLEVSADPDVASISTSGTHGEVRVVTLVIVCQTIVEALLLDDEFKGGIIRPFKAKESCHEILGALEHPIFGCCASNDLAIGVI